MVPPACSPHPYCIGAVALLKEGMNGSYTFGYKTSERVADAHWSAIHGAVLANCFRFKLVDWDTPDRYPKRVEV